MIITSSDVEFWKKIWSERRSVIIDIDIHEKQ